MPKILRDFDIHIQARGMAKRLILASRKRARGISYERSEKGSSNLKGPSKIGALTKFPRAALEIRKRDLLVVTGDPQRHKVTKYLR